MTLAPSDLLRKLAEHAERMEQFGDASITTVVAAIDELDARGGVLHQLRSVARVERVSGRSLTRIEHATRDGKDDRAAAQRRADEEDRAPKKESPFAANKQPHHRFQLLAPERIAIAPAESVDRAAGAMRGEALIDPASGECLRLAGRPAHFAPLIDRADFVFEYAQATPHGRMLSSMHLEYAGGLLFLRKQGVVRMRFTYASLSQRERD